MTLPSLYKHRPSWVPTFQASIPIILQSTKIKKGNKIYVMSYHYGLKRKDLKSAVIEIKKWFKKIMATLTVPTLS